MEILFLNIEAMHSNSKIRISSRFCAVISPTANAQLEIISKEKRFFF